MAFEGTWEGTDDELSLEGINIRIWCGSWYRPNVCVGAGVDRFANVVSQCIDRELPIFRAHIGSDEQENDRHLCCRLKFILEMSELGKLELDFRQWALVQVVLSQNRERLFFHLSNIL